MSVGNAAGEGLSGQIKIYNPASTSTKCFMTWDFTYLNASGNFTRQIGGGGYDTATAINGIRIMSESGNITSGTFTLYGVI